MAIAKAAGTPPKVSSGKVYILTLNAATAKMASEIPAEAQAALGARGRAAVARATTDAARQTPKRAAGVEAPRSTRRFDNHPPQTPPKPAKSGGIQAYQADSCW